MEVRLQYSDYKISSVNEKEEFPFSLLLLADETTTAIERYIYDSKVYIVRETEQSVPVAVFALYSISKDEVEIKNIAIAQELQGKGLGSFLINEIKRIAREAGYKNILVGTGDHSYRQISFYKRNGFSVYDIRKDFFIKNYPDPVMENGFRLMDMVMFKRQI